MVITLTEARVVFGPIGISRVDVGLDPGASAVSVSNALERTLTTEPYVLTGPGDLGASLRASTGAFQALTSLLAAVALFVGAFLIFNTLSMTVTERIREVGLLRAAGATRRQVAGIVLAQALVLGIVGSAIGIAIGLGLAAVMVAYVRSIASVPIDGLSVPLVGVVLAIVVGVAVTIAAALEPAIRAGRVSPIEALRARPADLAASGPARLRWLIVVFAVVAVAGSFAWPAGGAAGSPLRALVVYAILLGATVLTPFILPPLARIAGIPFGWILRTEERLARGVALRDPSRTALTVGALLVGLAMVVAVGDVAQNARRSANAWLVDVVPGDEIVTSIVPAAIDEEGPGSTLAAVPGVARVTPMATFDAAYQGIRLDAAAITGKDLLADGRLTFVAGDRTSALTGLDGGGTVILPRSQSERLGLGLGATMRFTVGAATPANLRVAGIVERTLPGKAGETVLVGWSDATALFGVLGADSFAVRFAPGASADARPALEAAARELALEPNTLDAVRGAIGDALGQVFGLFDALAVVAVLVAGLGIVNTLTMNVVERVREIGVLRATGMTRSQVWRMVVIEAGVLDKGYRINLDGTRHLIDAIRHAGDGYKPRLVFTSSIAVFGAPFPEKIGDEFFQYPADQLRHPEVDLRTPDQRLHSARACSTASRSACRRSACGRASRTRPLPASSPTLSASRWRAKRPCCRCRRTCGTGMPRPKSAVGFLIHACPMDLNAIGPRRNLSMPGMSVTVGEQIAALDRVAGKNVTARIKRVPDPDHHRHRLRLAARLRHRPRAQARLHYRREDV